MVRETKLTSKFTYIYIYIYRERERERERELAPLKSKVKLLSNHWTNNWSSTWYEDAIFAYV